MYLKQGTKIFDDQWTVIRSIGSGGFGEIYEVEDDYHNRAILKYGFIKLVEEKSNENSDPFVFERVRCFEQEIQINREMNCRNTVKLLRTECKSNNNYIEFFLLMEKLETLDHYLHSRNVNLENVLKIIIDVGYALSDLHKQNIVHNDIKISNIFFNGQEFLLGDFGNSSLNLQKMGLYGTRKYIAPEIIFGKAFSFSSDIYSLGMVLYVLLNNMNFPILSFSEGESGNMETRSLDEIFPKSINADEKLREIINKACDINVKKRYQSIDLFVSDLKLYKEKNSDKLDNIVLSNLKNNSDNEITVGSVEIPSLENNSDYEITENSFTSLFNGFTDNTIVNSTPFLDKSNNLSEQLENNFDDKSMPFGTKDGLTNHSPKMKLTSFQNWLFFTCIVGLFPIILYISFSFIIIGVTINKSTYIHEIIFFSFVILITMIRDLIFGNEKIKNKTNYHIYFAYAAMMFILTVALFASLVLSEVVGLLKMDMDKLLFISIVTVILNLIIGGIVERWEDE